MNGPKKLILVGGAALIVGVLVGWIAAIKTFAVDIDVLGIPYSNEPVIATRDLRIAQGDIELTIPKGTTLVHR